uniref:Uncharacterized protein n=1 Tax=Rhizophora mucronata TaxID=61149 RepID=A0A2P2QTV3_RHIMU
MNTVKLPHMPRVRQITISTNFLLAPCPTIIDPCPCSNVCLYHCAP